MPIWALLGKFMPGFKWVGTMMALNPQFEKSEPCRELISRLDHAVANGECERICSEIKAALEQTLGDGADFLPECLLVESQECYARHLMHRDPHDRYSAVAMVWAPGQGTPLHDHAGKWCVEGVYSGKIRVTSYDLERQLADGHYRFREEASVEATRGAAGALIPPFEYHVISNPFDETAVTVHVYCGEMKSCHIFLPEENGTFRREERQLSYS